MGAGSQNAWGVTLTAHPHLAPSPLWVFTACSSVNCTFTFYLLLFCLFRVHRDSQKSGVLKICCRHTQLNYFLTCWHWNLIT